MLDSTREPDLVRVLAEIEERLYALERLVAVIASLDARVTALEP